MRDDPRYKAAYRQAIQEAGDALEDKLNDLAHEGNVTAAIFLLKGLRPEKYKERSQIDTVWNGDPSQLSDEQLAKLQEWMLSQACGGDPVKIADTRRQLEIEARAAVEQVVDVVAVPASA